MSQDFRAEEGPSPEDLTQENRRLSKAVRSLERKLRRMSERAEFVEQINNRNTAVEESMRRKLLSDLKEREDMLEELERQKHRAEAGIEAKARFIANISHEIRTPMNGVFGMLDLLSSTNLNAEQRELLDTARSSANWLLTLINDVLDFSKVEAGQLELARNAFDMRECIDSSVSFLRARAIAADVHLLVDFPEPEPSMVRGDPDRLRQVLVNLLGNAIKFTHEGEVRLRAHYDLSEERFSVRIEDTGIGIPASRLDVIFDPFSQADSSTTRRFGGTGLGLSISREIVRRMGGELWVQSEEGKGSTFGFSVVLPRAPAMVQEPFEWPVVVDLRDPAERRNVMGLLARADIETIDSEENDLLAVLKGRLGALAIVDEGGRVALEGTTVDRVVCVSRDLTASRSSQGSTPFLIPPVGYMELLRALKRRATPMSDPTQSLSVIDAERGGRQERRILVVEDNVVNQKLACRFLERAGYRADVAQDGAEGVERFTAGHYDIVLMDCQMPVMNGFEASRRIRTMGERGRVPIIALTASASAEDRARCLAAGMNEVLTKPLQYPRLAQMLDEFLGL